MANTIASRNELIVTGFGDTHTAFLARATLARLQRELGMATVAVQHVNYESLESR